LSAAEEEEEKRWFVLHCKFDRQVAPLLALARSFNDFFERCLNEVGQVQHHQQQQQQQHVGNNGIIINSDRRLQRQRAQLLQATFDKMSLSIISHLDTEVFGQLCELMPVFVRMFPLSVGYIQKSGGGVVGGTGTGNIGSGRNRVRHLFHILLNSIFCVGHPVVIVLDDLQWSDSLAMDVILGVIQSKAHPSSNLGSDDDHVSPPSREGLFLLGSYRDNEADANLLQRISVMDVMKQYVKVTHLSIGMLSRRDIDEMLSYKLGLPMRYTRDLSEQVFQKTRGHPLFVQTFLRSIISKGVLSFSVRSRRWTWDDLVIELHTISEDVAEFLAHGLRRLDKNIVYALQVCSCLGFQVTTAIIELLDSGRFMNKNNMLEALESAKKEGLMDKAGPIYAFSHDMLRESTYELIPESERKPLHRKIGLSLAKDPNVWKDSEICTLAVDQINVCKENLNQMERLIFARLNLSAGKHSMASSSYEQARGYFESGISLLHARPWKKQYALCLELYEMSAVVGFMDGGGENVSSRLDDILSNAKCFGDTIKSRELLLKVIASRGEYAESTSQCLSTLSKLGENFPKEIESSKVTKEIVRTMALLKDITKDDIRKLPLMTNPSKLYAMKFLSMLCTLSLTSRKNLCHLASCLMVKFTFKYGFCEESIHGLGDFARGLLLETQDIVNSIRIVSLAESLMSGHPNHHALRARLTLRFCVVKPCTEPVQTCIEHYRNGFNSGMISGDIENAMTCGYLCCFSKMHSGNGLQSTQDACCDFLRQLAKHKHVGSLNGTMSVFDTCAALSGNSGNSLGIKTNEEIFEEAKQKKNSFLLHQVCLNQIFVQFYFRDHLSVMKLAEVYNNLDTKRAMDVIQVYFTGISALALSRCNGDKKLRKIGEQSLGIVAQCAQWSKWNFENKVFLLQAELHYLNNDFRAAEVAYKASVDSAQKHKFIHEEAMAYELYGIFLIETRLVERGLEQLNMAISKYAKWGGRMKVGHLISFMKGC